MVKKVSIFNHIFELKKYENNFKREDIWLYFIKSRSYELPNYGFKIHVSSTLFNYIDIFKLVIPELIKIKIKFKIIGSQIDLINLNSGIFGFTQIGKTITIYPENKIELLSIIEKLYFLTKKYLSVEIYSDYNYKNSKVIFYRYGEFFKTDKIDKRLKRIPKNIRCPISDHYIKRNLNLPIKYKLIECLSIKGKSKVFKIIDTEEKKIKILKEGISNGDILDGKDGFNMVYKEYLLLEKFNKVDFFPKILDKFYLKENFCIVEEFAGSTTRNMKFI